MLEGFSTFIDIQLPEWKSTGRWEVLPGLESLQQSGQLSQPIYGPLPSQIIPSRLVPSSIVFEGKAKYDHRDFVWVELTRFVRKDFRFSLLSIFFISFNWT